MRNWIKRIFGFVTPHQHLIRGKAYPFAVLVEGSDLRVIDARATWFGGSHDPQDSGETASGISTKKNPQILGCALPMDFRLKGLNPCKGAPFPRLAWFTPVEVVNRSNNRRVIVKLIDLGPTPPPLANAAIDLTVAAFQALGGDLKAGKINVDFRVYGAADQLPEGWPA